jgi:hypothetical protein
MASNPPLDRLQKIADYRTTCKFLRRKGKSAIIFGALFMYLGVMLFAGRIVDYLYLGVATCELLIGLRNRLRPSATGVILDGGMLVLLSVWNLAMQLLWLQAGGDIRIGAAIDVLIAVAGIRRIAGYGRARDAFQEPPTPDQLDWFDDLIHEIQTAKAAETSDMIQFKSGLRWKGRRLGDMVVFVDKLDFENLVVDRHDIEILDDRKSLLSNARQVKLRLGRKLFKVAEFSPKMLEILETWQIDDETADAAPADEPETWNN